jgi:hypothetical protein
VSCSSFSSQYLPTTHGCLETKGFARPILPMPVT